MRVKRGGQEHFLVPPIGRLQRTMRGISRARSPAKARTRVDKDGNGREGKITAPGQVHSRENGMEETREGMENVIVR